MKLPRLLVLLLSLAASMTATPASPAGNFLVRDLGVPIKAVNWVRLHPGRGPDGKASLLASMGQNNGGLFVIDIDLATGHCRQFNAPSAKMQTIYPSSSAARARLMNFSISLLPSVEETGITPRSRKRPFKNLVL